MTRDSGDNRADRDTGGGARNFGEGDAVRDAHENGADDDDGEGGSGGSSDNGCNDDEVKSILEEKKQSERGCEISKTVSLIMTKNGVVR